QGLFISRAVTDIGAAGTRENRMWGLSWQPGSTPSTGYTNTRVSTQPLDSPNDVFTKGQWHHVALVWGNVDGSNNPLLPAQRVYVDGDLVAEDEDSAIYEFVSNENWLIGNDWCCANREFEGLIDDMAVFDSALSSSQIQTLYNNALSGIDAAGNATGQLALGDVDGVGGVSIDDFNIIRDNLGSTVSSRSMGDITGDRKVDLNDFQLWLDSVPPELAAMAMAVPEPSSVALGAMALLAATALGRRRRAALLAVPLAGLI